jgi:hypothetical protein
MLADVSIERPIGGYLSPARTPRDIEGKMVTEIAPKVTTAN